MSLINHKSNHHRFRNNHNLKGRNHGSNHLSTDYIMIQSQYCTSCETCIKECPRGVIGKIHFLKHEHAHIDNPDDCIGCKKCVKSCPNKAIIELTNSNISPKSGKKLQEPINSSKNTLEELPQPRSHDRASTILDLLR